MSRSRPLPDDRRHPHPARLPADAPAREEILRCHDAALARGATFYVDPPTGRLVMTAQALWDRGACCDTGCRHCPYVARPGEGVPSP